MTKKYIFAEGTLTTKVTIKNDKIKVKAHAGYAPEVDELCTVTDTGNGFLVKMHSQSGHHNYFGLDYSHAVYLLMALLAEYAEGEIGNIELLDASEVEQE